MSDQWATIGFVNELLTSGARLTDAEAHVGTEITYYSMNGIKPCREWARNYCRILIDGNRGRFTELFVKFSDDTAYSYTPKDGWREVLDVPEGAESTVCAYADCGEEALSTNPGSICVDHAYERSIPSDGIWALHNPEQ
jgi:hypothetical protein